MQSKELSAVFEQKVFPRKGKGWSQAGFTLLEIIIVMGIMGSIASVILPNIGLTTGSRVSMSLREIAGTLRSTYDNSILSGRINRVVFSLRTGEYWTEVAPLNFSGRPSTQMSDLSPSEQRAKDYKLRLLEELDKLFIEPRRAGGGSSERSYSVRSMLAIQRNVLREKKWDEVEDAVLTRRRLPFGLMFWNVAAEGMSKPVSRKEMQDGDLAHIYFFPWGEGTRAQIQIATQLSEAGDIDENGPKNTLSLDSLTGQSAILDGLQEAEFLKEF